VSYQTGFQINGSFVMPLELQVLQRRSSRQLSSKPVVHVSLTMSFMYAGGLHGVAHILAPRARALHGHTTFHRTVGRNACGQELHLTCNSPLKVIF
jgi:hypothetical protein